MPCKVAGDIDSSYIFAAAARDPAPAGYKFQ